ncbi:MAG: methionine biosynthesis protein MetW [Burkholderiales bacterium]|nr:MAG: methionine biosynthesis protein MetW [Burkholderiales bacterium]TAG82344.1 MAG: methionine biosynthesis protein MetW [Betaproteobacteria bacterium]
MNLAAHNARADFDVVSAWVPQGARVLDLGCGDGALLARLIRERNCRGYGVEIDSRAVLCAMQNGINVIQSNIEGGLAFFRNRSFDVVVLSQTLQATRHTEALIKDVLAIGKSAIVTIPNFAHWQVRWQLGVGGRMPVSKRMPYQWYDTPNVHFSSILDFDNFCGEKAITIERKIVLAGGREVKFLPNLRGETAVFQIRA